MAATVIVRPLTSGTEARRLLDQVKVALGGDETETGLTVAADRGAVEAALDRASGTWPIHVTVRDE